MLTLTRLQSHQYWATPPYGAAGPYRGRRQGTDLSIGNVVSLSSFKCFSRGQTIRAMTALPTAVDRYSGSSIQKTRRP